MQLQLSHTAETESVRRVRLFVCLEFNGTFSTNRLYRAITVGLGFLRGVFLADHLASNDNLGRTTKRQNT